MSSLNQYEKKDVFMCLNPLAGKQKKAADMTQRHFYPDRGRTVVLGFGNI